MSLDVHAEEIVALWEASGPVESTPLHHLAKTRGVTVVLATHERRFAERCDRMLHVRQGRIEST